MKSSLTIAHHPVLAHFPPWRGRVNAGLLVNFLGVTERAAYLNAPHPEERFVTTDYPAFDEMYFEWIDLLEAVLAARRARQREFTMIELGAGFGRWIVNAAAALRAIAPGSGPEPRLIAVEAEPTHFAWIADHLRDNGFDSTAATLIPAAVAPVDGEALFYTGAASAWWGQEMYEPTGRRKQIADVNGESVQLARVRAVSLNTILAPLDRVDLIDMDIQGAELDVCRAAASELNAKVHRVHIGTHRPWIDLGLRDLFASLGWRNVWDFPCKRTQTMPFGEIDFEDGVQAWVNPRFEPT
jgi:FkbM family methyltransferase